MTGSLISPNELADNSHPVAVEHVVQARVLLISYAFPPDNASGAIRVGKFVAHLSQHYGWLIDVITPKRKSMSSQSAENHEPFAESVSIRATRNFEIFDFIARFRKKRQSDTESTTAGSGAVDTPTRGENSRISKQSIAGALSDFLAVPDTRTGWIIWAVCEALRSISKSREPTVILSSGPPHSAHVAASIVQTLTRRPWVADLRDPWSDNPYNAVNQGPAAKWNRFLERTVLGRADGIICNTVTARQRVRQQFSDFTDERILTIPNGFDPEDFKDITPHAIWPEQSGPVLMHAGSIYGKRLPYGLLEAIGILNADDPTACPSVVFLGEWDSAIRAIANQIIERFDLADKVVIRAALSRNGALAAQAAADGLILLGDSSMTGLQVPGKLFEYLRLQKPILSLFPSGSPVEHYLERFAPLHAVAPPDDTSAIACGLRQLCSQMKDIVPDFAIVNELSREHQVRLVHRLLKHVMSGTAVNCRGGEKA